MIILASKQFYELSYFADTVVAFGTIITTKQIRLSTKPEYDPNMNNNKYRYTSFSRDLLAAPKRNPSKWRFGVILDGELLTDRYSFISFSYAGVALYKGDMLKIEYIIYDKDGKGELKLFGRSPIYISNALAQSIISKGDFSRYRFEQIMTDVHKYYTKNRRIAIYISDIISNRQYAEITKSSSLNEYEERIWNHNKNERFMTNENHKYINILGCIKGFVLPMDLKMKECNVVNSILMDVFNYNGTVDDLVHNQASDKMTCTMKDGFYIIRLRGNI